MKTKGKKESKIKYKSKIKKSTSIGRVIKESNTESKGRRTIKE